MKHTFILAFVLFLSAPVLSQKLGNEWINKNQNYYKFKISNQGIYKIDSNTLASNGVDLANINPSRFQLFKNGEEQPVYIKGDGDGVFNANDYLLFFATKNDGELDAELYKTKNDQPHQFNSLFSDTSVFFFTILPANTTQIAKRFEVFNQTNYSSYTPESYFVNEVLKAPIEEYYRGLFLNVGQGEFYYFSEYLAGESWMGNKFGLSESRIFELSTPNLFIGGENPNLEAKVFGTSNDATKQINHHLRIGVSNNNTNYTTIKDTTYAGYTETKYQINLTNADIGSNTYLKFETVADLGLSSDFNAVSYFTLKYASTFNLNNKSQLFFKHKAQQNSNRIYFQFLNYIKTLPLLLDLTTNKLITCSLNSNTVNVLCENVNQEQNFFLFDETDLKEVTQLENVDMDFLNPSGNYEFVIISNKKLENIANDYQNYRAQKFKTALTFSNDLYNQFFYGYEHPLAIKHFLKYLYVNQTNKPEYVLLLGRGFQNNLVRNNFQNAYANNLVPAIGEPSSDHLYTVGLNTSFPYTPGIATGRVPIANETEGQNYLNKLISYEKDTIFDNEWRKEVLHLSGGGDVIEQKNYTNELKTAQNKISGYSFGANVVSFNKNSSEPVQSDLRQTLINEINKGKSLMTFLGHGSLSVLDVDFGKISDLQNTNKYTFFYFNGCNIGNANDADPLGSGNIYGKDFLVAPNKGAIGWLAHSNLTLTSNLFRQIHTFYENLSTNLYGKEIGKIIQQSIAQTTVTGDLYDVSHANQLLYQGDPALKIGSPFWPDYKVENNDIYLTDKNISSVVDSFEMNVILRNLGKAVKDSISVSILHELGSNGEKFLYDSLIVQSPKYADTISFKLKGQGKKMAGNNVFTVKLDYLNQKTESDEGNNQASLSKFIPGSGIDVLFPLNNSILNNDTAELIVQNNDLFSTDKEYIFEIDTNTNFSTNSSFYKNSGIIKANDLAKWKIGLGSKDSTVYFWRAKLIDQNPLANDWVTASFTYIKNGSFGFMQSHFKQFSNASAAEKVIFDSIKRQMNFVDAELVLGIQNKRFDHRNMGVIVPYQLNEGVGTCPGNNLVAFVFEPFQVEIPYEIPNYPFNCAFVQNNKQNRSRRYYPFATNTPAELTELRRFIDSIPSGYYVAMFSRYGTNIQNWDQATLNSFRNNFGLNKIPSIQSKNTAWAFISAKNAASNFAVEDTINNDSLGALVDAGQVSLPPQTNQAQDTKLLSINKALVTKWFTGSMTSAPFGPVKAWNKLNFQFNESEVSVNSKFFIDLIGLKTNGSDTILYENITNSSFDLTGIDAKKIPYLKLRINMEDSAKRTPQEFGFWQIICNPLPEAKLSASHAFVLKNNPIDEGDSLQLEIGIENLTSTIYDSVNFNIKIIDDSRITKYEQNLKLNELSAFNKNIVKTKLPTMGLKSNNQLQLSLNNDKRVNEITFNNNFLTANFTVKNDNINPFIDVTFDGVKIMNGDIVSASPRIMISSKDNNQFILQKDTSLFKLMLLRPNSNSFDFENVNLNSNEIQFIPASDANNLASLIYTPQNLKDGKYTLKVLATDVKGNSSGADGYEIEFNIINKSTITNFFPYPNPATDNVRFVFTLTGSTLPDELLIRISTISGKVVKEITKEEFGNIKFGNNISQYAWNGNDMFGDRLANGVYLYQVFTKIKGNTIELKNTKNADAYFTEGVGKIYLMR